VKSSVKKIEQVEMDAGIGVGEDSLGGQSLGAVAGNRVTMIEAPVVSGVEFDATIIVESGGGDSASGTHRAVA